MKRNLDKIISENINNYLKENLETEYLDKYYGIPLKKYFKMSDEDKIEDKLWRYANYLADYLDRYNRWDEVPEEFQEELVNMCENYDNESIISFIKEHCSDDLIDDFLRWVTYDDSQPLTYDIMDYTRDVHNEWLIHFSDNAAHIAYEGFKYATEDMNELGYSGAGQISNKSSEGWDFAYLANDCPRDGNKYGSDAVMFQASGIKATHYGDEEEQVMFWNKDAKNLVLIQSNNGYTENSRGDYAGDWYITSTRTNEVIYGSDEISDVIAWVQNNFAQYRKHLIEPRESKMRRKQMQNSEHTYYYKNKG